jgi:hypothetical protein
MKRTQIAALQCFRISDSSQGTIYGHMGSGAANKLLAKSAKHFKTQVGPNWARQDEKERKRRQFLATWQDG